MFKQAELGVPVESLRDREEEGKDGVKNTEQRGLLLTSYLVFLGDLVVYIARKTVKYKY